MVYMLGDQLFNEFGARGSNPGRFDGPNGICVDDSGAVYVADLQQSCAGFLTYTIVLHSRLRFLPYVGVVHSTVYLHCTVCIYVSIIYIYIYNIYTDSDTVHER